MANGRELTAKEQYDEFLSTWGPHCGAPLSVLKGHLDALIRKVRQEAKSEQVLES